MMTDGKQRDGRPELKPGDVVMLKSGGPKMTIRHVRPDDDVWCYWFDGAELREAIFGAKIINRREG